MGNHFVFIAFYYQNMLIISYSLNSNTSYLFDNADNNADYYDYVVNTDNIKAKMNMTNSTVNVA